MTSTIAPHIKFLPRTRLLFSLPVCSLFALAVPQPLHAQADSDLLSSEDGIVQRPTGSGTKPDGVVDESMEGLFNETDTEDFIDNSNATSITPPLLETEDAGPDPATSAEDLEPPVGAEDFNVIERAERMDKSDG